MASSSSAPAAPSREQIQQAACTVGAALKDADYAIVGGAACTLLGSSRTTLDVDFVVPQGKTVAARSVLKALQTHFVVENKTLHTWYKSNPMIEIEILTPPALFKGRFDDTTPVVLVNGVKILKPSLLLNAKCGSILGRADEEKKRTDAADIRFLLQWFLTKKVIPAAAEVPSASKQFVQWYISMYGGQDFWVRAGYNLEKGQFGL